MPPYATSDAPGTTGVVHNVRLSTANPSAILGVAPAGPTANGKPWL